MMSHEVCTETLSLGELMRSECYDALEPNSSRNSRARECALSRCLLARVTRDVFARVQQCPVTSQSHYAPGDFVRCQVRNDTDSNLHVLAYFSSINGEVCLLPTFAAFRKSKTSGYYHDIVGAVDFVTLGPGETGVTDVHTDLLPDRSRTGKGVLITVSTSLCPHAQGAEIFERVLKLLRERSQHDRLLGDGTVSVDIDWLVCAQ